MAERAVSPTQSRRLDAVMVHRRRVHERAHEVKRLRDLTREFGARLSNLNQAAADFATATIRQQTAHLLVLAGYLPLLAADLTLSAPTFLYYGSSSLLLTGLPLTTAMLAGPTAVFLVELSIAAQRVEYSVTRAADGAVYWALTAGAIALATVMAAMVYATQMARYVATTSATAEQVFLAEDSCDDRVGLSGASRRSAGGPGLRGGQGSHRVHTPSLVSARQGSRDRAEGHST